MTIAPPKTVRVEIEFDDGKILRLTGKDAQQWSERVATEGTLAAVHGCAWPLLPWVEFNRVVEKKIP